MADASDPVLFSKKAQKGTGANAVDGTCMISRTKVRWEPSDPSKTQPAVIEISAITRTQQAPGKPFIKLDTAAGPLILGFSLVTDRDDAVDLLKQTKPAAATKGAPSPGSGGGGDKLLVPTAAQAAALFREDKDLESVYKSLVVAGILGEQEFWRSRQGQLRDALARGGGGGGTQRLRQRVGLPSAMLADVKPSADGQTEKVHFQLTPQAIQQIFAERPEVHRAYLAHVPHSMDEKAFWTRYFKQQYKRMARRRRQGLTGDGGEDDDEDELFAPFRKQLQKQEAVRTKQAMGRVDPTVNVAADAGDRPGTGFGLLRDGTSDPTGALRRTTLDAIARDINRHAAVVLEGAPEGLGDLEGPSGGSEEQQQQQQGDTSRIAMMLAAQQKAAAAKTTAGTCGHGGGNSEGSVSPERLEEWQQRAASALEDLNLDDRDKQHTLLNIQDPRAYFDAAAPAAGGTEGKEQQQQQQQQGAVAAAHWAAGAAAGANAASSLLAALAAIRPLALPDPPCNPALATAVLLELSQDQDEELIREFGPVAAAALQFPPQDHSHGVQALLLEHLRAEALKINELLRHFWACMPLLSTARADKAAKLARHLQEQRTLLASHMRHHAGYSQQVHVTMMLRPLEAAIDAALARHQWEAEQRQQRQQKLQ